MRLLRIGVLTGFLAASLVGFGLVPIGCCDSSCPACPSAFCKETPQAAFLKASLVALLPATIPQTISTLGPLLAWTKTPPADFDFKGFRPPMRN
jgi:hypothetical protein